MSEDKKVILVTGATGAQGGEFKIKIKGEKKK